jgi:ketosteroid isomerase-like protein
MQISTSPNATCLAARCCCARMCALTGIIMLAGCAGAGPSVSSDSLLLAERAFATQAAREGVRASFLANFADDGIAFEPAPVRLRETWEARPAAKDPKAVQLAWEPAFAAIAASGDLGFTTGPFELSLAGGAGPPEHGIYTSVWRRDSGGTWKVVLDAGVGTPMAIPVGALLPATRVLADMGTATQTPGALERGFAMAPATALAHALAPDVRWYQEGEAPVIGLAEIVAMLAVMPPRYGAEPAAEVMSTSRDFAYTYGTLNTSQGTNGARRHYVHLWTRGNDGRWQIAVMIWLAANSTPP